MSIGKNCGLFGVTLALTVTPLPSRAITNVWIAPTPGLNNWSSAGNWNGGVPAPGADVKFFDTGATIVSNINNVVDAGFLNPIGFLQYGSTNNSHTTLIAAGQTLTIV